MIVRAFCLLDGMPLQKTHIRKGDIMKAMKKWIGLFLCLTLLLGVAAYFPATAEAKERPKLPPLTSGKCGQGVKFSFDSGTGTLTIEGRGPMTDYQVGYSPFAARWDIVHVVIGDGVTSVGAWAFYDCDELLVAELGKDIKTVSQGAFFGCVSLSSITLPEGLTTIESNGFEHCIAWKEISLPESVTSLGAYAFDDTGHYRNKKNWEDNVLYFGTFLYSGKYNEAYFDSRLKGDKPYVSDVHNSARYKKGEITVKDGTKVIMENAFEYCKLITGVTIPDSVTKIEKNAFYGCGFKSITLPKYLITIEENTFNYCKSLESVTLPKNLKEIGKGAFKGSGSLTKITLPSGLISVGDGAFAGSGLKSVTIPKSVRGVGAGAFKDCKSLKKVTIKSGVRAIGEYAFNNCGSLKSVTVPKSVTTIGKKAFGYKYEDKVPGFKLRGYKNSAAQKYAKNNKIKFVVVK